MKKFIKLDIEDINTKMLGVNLEITINEGYSIVFSPEAMEELIKDYTDFKSEALNTKSE